MSERDLEMKSFGPFEIKSEDRGEVEAIVATLGVVDKDGDVILPGAVPSTGAIVKLSGYNHDVITDGAPPVGKGRITEEGDHLVFRGKFFMSTERGREAFHHTKEMGEDGEWSFGFPKTVKTAPLTDEWRTKGARRMIAALDAIEASPVFVGAGWGTQTVLTKSADESLETPEEVENRILYGDPEATPPAGELRLSDAESRVDPVADIETPAVEAPEELAPEETAEQKAAKLAEIERKAQRERAAEAVEEFRRVQRALRRMGHAA